MTMNFTFQELLGPIIVINVPRWYTVLWSVAKYFVTARTRTKVYSYSIFVRCINGASQVTVYGVDYAQKLKRVIPPKDYAKLMAVIEESNSVSNCNWNTDSKEW